MAGIFFNKVTPNIVILNLRVLALLLLTDLVNAQSAKKSNNPVVYIVGIIILIMLFVGCCLYCFNCGTSKESAVVEPRTNLTVAQQTNSSTDTLSTQRIREQEGRSRDRIYSISIELNERNTISSVLEGQSRHTNTSINPLYSLDTHPIPNATVVNRANSASIPPEKVNNEEAPPSYNSLFRNKW